MLTMKMMVIIEEKFLLDQLVFFYFFFGGKEMTINLKSWNFEDNTYERTNTHTRIYILIATQ